jgi:hypothetical protein
MLHRIFLLFLLSPFIFAIFASHGLISPHFEFRGRRRQTPRDGDSRLIYFFFLAFSHYYATAIFATWPAFRDFAELMPFLAFTRRIEFHARGDIAFFSPPPAFQQFVPRRQPAARCRLQSFHLAACFHL